MKHFEINARVYVDCEHGLLPGRVLGRKVDGTAFQVGVNLLEIDECLRVDVAGKRWYDAAHVLTAEQHDERVAIAAEMMERS